MKVKKIESMLLEILESATMNNCNFSLGGNGLPTCEADVDKFIKERTELWRESWVVEPIKMVLREMNKEQTEAIEREIERMTKKHEVS